VDLRPDRQQRISALAALDQPLRRELFRLVGARDTAVSRDEAAEALGIPRSVAAFHLDKLAEAGLVEVRFERTTGRTGPGAGRPAKLYRRSPAETAVSVPDRHYDLAGSLLATAIDESTRTGAPVAECLATTARTAGRDLAEEIGLAWAAGHGPRSRRDEVVQVLERCGYEPRTVGRDAIALRNCPFHRLAEQHRSLVCGMNLDLLSGLLEGSDGTEGLSARLDPQPGYCCVRIGD
jgi:predicted ArsR family transcriptional regulator